MVLTLSNVLYISLRKRYISSPLKKIKLVCLKKGFKMFEAFQKKSKELKTIWYMLCPYVFEYFWCNFFLF